MILSGSAVQTKGFGVLVVFGEKLLDGLLEVGDGFEHGRA